MRHIPQIALIFLGLLPIWVAAQRAEQDGPPQAAEKRPWVGVSVSPAPSSLGHQLKLGEGVGLIVEFVQPKSPAAEAGLQPYDLLLKLDDQWLVNPEQFAVLVRMHHAGDDIKLSFIREGTEHTAKAKLVDHEFAHLPGWERGAPGMGADSLPPEHARPGGHASTRVLTWVDGHRQVSVTTTNGRSELVVKDIETGSVSFDGPIDTDEQRKALPPDVRTMLDSLVRISSAFGTPLNNNGKSPSTKDQGHQQP